MLGSPQVTRPNMKTLYLMLSLGALLCAPAAQRAEAQQKQDTADWTVLVYAAVDNDWEEPFMRDIRKMRKGLKGVKGVEVVLLIDRSPDYSRDKRALGEDFSDTRLYRLTGGEAERLGGEPELAGLTESSELDLNTGDARTLRDFIRYGKRAHPAERYALWCVSHGEGPMSCPDETTEDILFTAELTDVLGEEDSVDLLGFDACLMASVENAYQWRRREGAFGADFLVASAPLSSSWPYEEIFAGLKKRPKSGEGFTASAFGERLVDELKDQITGGRSDEHGLERDLQTWGSFDLGEVAAAKRDLDLLAAQLWKDEAKDELLQLRGSGLEAPTFVYVWPERNANRDMPNVDLAHLCERITKDKSFSKEARSLADDAAKSAKAVVSSSFGLKHYEGFREGEHGLYLIFPEGDTKTRRGKTYWSRMGWYNALELEGDEDGYGKYAWCMDGAEPANGEVENWFELMDAWFDISGSEDPGGSNGYAW